MGDVVRGPCFTGNDFLLKCIYKSCDGELELFMSVNSSVNEVELDERRNRKRDDPFDRSLNSVVYSVIITLFDIKKKEGGRLQWKATGRLLFRWLLSQEKERPPFLYLFCCLSFYEPRKDRKLRLE